MLVWDDDKDDYVELVGEKLGAVEVALHEKNPLKAILAGQSEECKFVWEVTKNILLYCARKVPEITTDYKLIDKAMVWGYNWELGPFQMWDDIGVPESIERMKKEGETIPQWILDRLNEGNGRFHEGTDIEAPYVIINSSKNKVIRENKDAALVDIGDDVLCLDFNTKENTITDKVMDMMHEAVFETERNYKGLVIGNEGKNFSTGANLTIIANLALEKDRVDLEQFVEESDSKRLIWHLNIVKILL